MNSHRDEDTFTADAASRSAELPVLPLRDAVLFPGSVMPFDVGRPKTVALAEYLARSKDQATVPLVVTFTQKRASTEDPDADELHAVGTIARVLGVVKADTGTYALVLEGVARGRLEEVTQRTPFLKARVERLPEVTERDDELDALGQGLRDATREVLALLPRLPREVTARIDALSEPAALADFVAGHLDTTVGEKVALLELVDPKERVRGVLKLVVNRREALRTRERINSQVRDEMGKTQREHVLRQQLKAVQDELGMTDEGGESDLADLEKRIAGAGLTKDAADVAKKQLKRLRSMQTSSPEYAMIRTYLDWILDVPWTNVTDDQADIAAVRAVLDEDHYGLEKVKRRILEYLAVRKLKSDKKGPILCLIGPPGVGKTSLGRSIARALGRNFQRMSLGGVHDEAAIRGHRRTYIGALPGQIIQAMKKAGTVNPVLMLDEVDKLGHDYRGDPSSALLEVLDPEQNNTFADHYLEIPYDLSNVMFIATANVGDTIPAPLRDRMEIIEIPSYTRREKHAIARRHLVPKQLTEHGIGADMLAITDRALAVLIDSYTREAGVRALERQIAALVRGVAVGIASGSTEKRTIDTLQDVRVLLGNPRFDSEVAERTEDPGVATGLAWTSVGGEILFVEATRMHGSGKLTLTGQLGDVMKESAQAALSYIRSGADRYGIPRDFLDKSDIHIHVPTGAMPKDGPSAGVTMLTALVSTLTGIRVRHDVAMTGEITLRGRVLPIGGLKEKVLAAHRAGIKRIIVPERNRHDLDEVPDEVKADLEFVFASEMHQVLEAALEERPTRTLPTLRGEGATLSA